MKKLTNPITKVVGNVTSSITYNTMTSYVYVATKPVKNIPNTVKNTTTKATDKVKSLIPKKNK